MIFRFIMMIAALCFATAALGQVETEASFQLLSYSKDSEEIKFDDGSASRSSETRIKTVSPSFKLGLYGELLSLRVHMDLGSSGRTGAVSGGVRVVGDFHAGVMAEIDQDESWTEKEDEAGEVTSSVEESRSRIDGGGFVMYRAKTPAHLFAAMIGMTYAKFERSVGELSTAGRATIGHAAITYRFAISEHIYLGSSLGAFQSEKGDVQVSGASVSLLDLSLSY